MTIRILPRSLQNPHLARLDIVRHRCYLHAAVFHRVRQQRALIDQCFRLGERVVIRNSIETGLRMVIVSLMDFRIQVVHV